MHQTKQFSLSKMIKNHFKLKPNQNNSQNNGPKILKYAINNRWGISGRAEYYQDKNAAIIATGTTNGFQTTGYSLNIDYSPIKNLLIRLEGRTLNSKDKIFIKGNNLVSNNSFITSSIAIAF